MARRSGPLKVRLHIEQLETREVPSTTPWEQQSFEGLPDGSLPSGWQQWTDTTVNSFGVEGAAAFDGDKVLTTVGNSRAVGRVWTGDVLPADFVVSTKVFLNSLQPVQIIARGRDLNTNKPTFYAVEITRGLEAKLIKVVDGVSTELASIRSRDYVTSQWVQVTLRPTGNKLEVEVYRPDTGKYLNAQQQWLDTPVSAIELTDSSISGDGYIGLNRPARYAATVLIDDFQILAPPIRENFDSLPSNQPLGTGWDQWTNVPAAAFQTSELNSQSPPRAITSSSNLSTAAARAWVDTSLPQNVQVSASVLLNNLLPARVIARGSNLDGSKPSYYAAEVTRGMEVRLLRVVDGVTTELGKIKSASYFSNQWVKVTLIVTDSRIQALVYRSDTGQYLDSAGNWKNGLARALDLHDDALSNVGFAGIERPASYAGTVTIDDFEVSGSGGDTAPPVVTINAPGQGETLANTVTVTATATDAGAIEHVEFFVDGVLRYSTTKAPYQWKLDTSTLENGNHTITVKAFDMAGNAGVASVTVVSQNDVLPRPTIPRHYNHIRIASLAYHGTPMTEFEKNLLRNSVDLLVPNPIYLSTIDQVTPNTPQLIYSNVSNLYEHLLLDWLAYADAHGIDRELAFYHAAAPTPWSHETQSSLPVQYFWLVGRGASPASLTNLTAASRDNVHGDVTFGQTGESVYIGFVEKFREVNFSMYLGATNGWKGVIEYACAVDAAGKPTAWKTLNLVSDSTSGFTKSGRIEFDPPADWKTATVSNSPRLYYIRIRTTAGTVPPRASQILGRNYSNSNGGKPPSGIIPVFDSAADLNNDGYLNDAEYAQRSAGKDARFLYESRIFYPYYGEMRFATNPASVELQEWAADYHMRFLLQNPLADGLFMDNSPGRSPLGNIQTLESSASYAEDYGSMLAAISRAIYPKFIGANTANGGVETDNVVRNVPVWIEEFAIRALAHNNQQFLDLAAMVAHRQSLKTPSPYAVLDSLPTGGSTRDARTLMATLAYYYMIGDPDTTFLMFFGGYAPASSWTEHWVQAAAYDIGRPKGEFSLFAQGADPANTALTYNVFQREYDNALVLYKPLSYKQGVGTGTLADNTATTHQLNGTYRVLSTLGTLGPPVTSVTLRNGEGVVLVKA